MDEHIAKRAKLSMEEVLQELDEDLPMAVGSDDEFDDITYTEKERDEYGAIEDDSMEEVTPSLSPHSTESSHHSSLVSVPGSLPQIPPTSVLEGLTQIPPKSVPGGLTHTQCREA